MTIFLLLENEVLLNKQVVLVKQEEFKNMSLLERKKEIFLDARYFSSVTRSLWCSNCSCLGKIKVLSVEPFYLFIFHMLP